MQSSTKVPLHSAKGDSANLNGAQACETLESPEDVQTGVDDLILDQIAGKVPLSTETVAADGNEGEPNKTVDENGGKTGTIANSQSK